MYPPPETPGPSQWRSAPHEIRLTKMVGEEALPFFKVLTHGFSSMVSRPLAKRFENCSVFFHRLLKYAGIGVRTIEDAVEQPIAIDVGCQPRAACCVGDCGMKLVVQLHPFGDGRSRGLALAKLLQGFFQALQSWQVNSVSAFGGSFAFQNDSHFIDVANIVRAETDDNWSAISRLNDQTILNQLLDRFVDRRAANV